MIGTIAYKAQEVARAMVKSCFPKTRDLRYRLHIEVVITEQNLGVDVASSEGVVERRNASGSDFWGDAYSLSAKVWGDAISFANSISTWHRNFGYIVKMHAIIFSEFYGRKCERYEEFSIY